MKMKILRSAIVVFLVISLSVMTIGAGKENSWTLKIVPIMYAVRFSDIWEDFPVNWKNEKVRIRALQEWKKVKPFPNQRLHTNSSLNSEPTA